MEQLQINGIEAIESYFDDFNIFIMLNSNIDIVIMHRVPHTEMIEKFITKARKESIPIIYDVDDLIYDKNYAKYSDGINYLDNTEKKLYFEGIERYQKTIKLCDGVIVSTDFLSETISKYNDNVAINRNAISKELEEISEKINQQYKNKNNDLEVIIGYFSGTRTHNKDFLEVSTALRLILTKYENVKFIIGGLLDLPEEFKEFDTRIIRLPLVDWRKLPENIKKVDINLAPLEQNNHFCKAKSELKYFEAAILKIPTIASGVEAFEHAIRDGHNGFLARDSKEWYKKLETLIVNKDIRRDVGLNAYNDVKQNYSSKNRGVSYIERLNKVANKNNSKIVNTNTFLTVNFLIPPPFKGSGGHTTILRMVKYLVDKGNKVNVYVQDSENLNVSTNKVLKNFIDTNFFKTGANYYKETSNFVKSDIFIATSWPTAYTVHSVNNTTEKFYFIQDFEPFFYAMSSEYKLAENSYKLGLKGITIGKWLTKKISNNYGMDCDFIDFAVDNKLYLQNKQERKDKPLRIIFYARATTPRRGVELGLQALEIISRKYKNNIEIVLFGGDQSLDIPFKSKNLGVLKPVELAELYKNADIALVLSLTNCSLLPLELMSSKCAVIDIEGDTVEGIMENGKNAILAKADPLDIANKISLLIDNQQLREKIQVNGYNFAKNLSWEDTGSQFEQILISKLMSLDVGQRIRNLKVLSEEQVKQPLPELTYGICYGQRINIKENYLSRIDLFVGTYGRMNKGKLIFHLKKSPNSINDIVTITKEINLLKDNSWVPFEFDPIENSAGETYYYWVECLATSGSGITLYINELGKELYVNHVQQDGTLCYRAYCNLPSPFYYHNTVDLDSSNVLNEVVVSTDIEEDEYSELSELKCLLGKRLKTDKTNNSAIYEISNRLTTIEEKLILFENSLPVMFYKKTKNKIGESFIGRFIKKIIRGKNT
ncbi:MAG: glycosyltransferase [Firmicutes bacterium]|nr:glycosyltransferase [Bacillota bacterium]